MSIIIGIHGLSNKPEAETLEKWWKSALLEGLKRNRRIIDVNFNFESVYWAKVMYPEGHDKNPEPYPYKDGNSRDEPLKRYEDAWYDEVRADVLDVGGSVLDAAKKWFGVTHTADEVLERKLPDLYRYYEEDDIRDKLRSLLRGALDPNLSNGERIMLISHSMGTIIAYDVLREIGKENPSQRLAHFVTIGSPLGLPHVTHKAREEWRMLRTPSIVDRWTNFADRRDPVSFDVHLADDYDPNDRGVQVRDDLVINDYGGIRHKSYGYLRTPELTDAVALFV